MISIPLTLALICSIGLVVHFLNAGEFWEATKAIFAAVGILVLLAACLTVRRKSREIGY